ncbi:MAG TPA: hypothetical protein GX404_07290 [Syntrophomonadaceae bacterium]|nr:hypothetical protein [Syntrophomonadaceae bacterium]
MSAITAVLISIAALLIAIALFTMSRQKAFMESYLQLFNDTLSEASLVRQDLEAMMENAVQVSETIIQDMDESIQQLMTLREGMNSLPVAAVLEDDGQLSRHKGQADLPQAPSASISHNNTQPDQPTVYYLTEQEEAYPAANRLQHQAQESFSLEDIKAAHPYIAVRTLYEQGYSIRDIAQLLERGQGEVELILNLTRKQITPW